MPHISRRSFALSALAFAAGASAAPPPVADIGHGVRLHYVEQGKGAPIVFVHGSLSDYTYWKAELAYFGRDRRAIAYSRRYNWPNDNVTVAGYSAITDADDLAGFISALHLEKPVIVGHSYGALTALFFAVRHPGVARAMVLAEPPAVSLLKHIEGPDAAKGRAMFEDILEHMVVPMHDAFMAGEREKGVAAFIDYVFGKPDAWDKFSAKDRAETMKDAHEWDVMMTNGTLFPDLPISAVRHIKLPVLMFSGAESYPFLRLTDAELARLLPQVQRFVIPGVGHQMWLQKTEFCRAKTMDFLAALRA